jgi:hypothetical protein
MVVVAVVVVEVVVKWWWWWWYRQHHHHHHHYQASICTYIIIGLSLVVQAIIHLHFGEAQFESKPERW